MATKGLVFTSAVLVAVLLVFFLWPGAERRRPQPASRTSPVLQPAAIVTILQTNSAAVGTNPPKIRHRMLDFTPEARASFHTNFTTQLKPALQRWCKIYGDRVPFDPNDVTVERFVERIGRDASYSEYIFVVDGVTLGIRDKNGSVRVDYLNAPKNTEKLAVLPTGGEPPILTSPLTREEVARLLEEDGGFRFQPHEIRIIPTGLSGSLNGGAFVNAGGDPENGASWAFDMIFSQDGKLAYYLKGVER